MSGDDHPLLRDFPDFFENSLCGHAVLDLDGRFLLCNGPLAGWLGYPAESLRGRPFSGFLPAGARIFHETHLAPLLRMQGHYSEVSMELACADGTRLPVFVNALQRTEGAEGRYLFTRLTVMPAKDRQAYEADLRQARDTAETSLLSERETAALREQFIAVLGHDLRNPLGAITMGTALLAESGLSDRHRSLVEVMDSSAKRMNELIGNLMDFARFRMGEGVTLDRRMVDLEEVFRKVIAELQTGNPNKGIESHFALDREIGCDPARLSQILSNLLANALTHGGEDQPVRVSCITGGGSLILTVSNRGRVIPAGIMESLFKPFAREQNRASQNGLGLGLYIASEVAKAHGGSLSVTSTDESTDFIFRMPLESHGNGDP